MPGLKSIFGDALAKMRLPKKKKKYKMKEQERVGSPNLGDAAKQIKKNKDAKKKQLEQMD